MKWIIKFTYDTGGSFETEYGVVGILEAKLNEDPYSIEYEWDDIAVAQIALQRMREHYEWQDSLITTYRSEDLPTPSWWTGKFDKRFRYSGDYATFNAPGNDGEELRFIASTYLGYFETLTEAEIVPAKSSIAHDEKNRFRF